MFLAPFLTRTVFRTVSTPIDTECVRPPVPVWVCVEMDQDTTRRQNEQTEYGRRGTASKGGFSRVEFPPSHLFGPVSAISAWDVVFLGALDIVLTASVRVLAQALQRFR